MKSCESTATQSNTPQTEHPLSEKIYKVFRDLPPETKYWVALYDLLLWAGDNLWHDVGVSDRLREIVLGDDIERHVPAEHAEASWLKGLEESLELSFQTH